MDGILEELLERQDAERLEKQFTKVGKLYTANFILEFLSMTVRTQSNYGDKHPEATLYNYEEECEEPLPPQESQFGLKVNRRPDPQSLSDILLEAIDGEIDLKEHGRSERLNRSKKFRNSFA